MTDDDGDPITFTTSFGTSSDAQFSTQAEAEAYLNAQHQALTQRTGRKRVIAGNTAAVLMSVRLKLRAIQSIGLNRFGFQTTKLKAFS